MFTRVWSALIVVATVAMAANVAYALGLQLGESKEELKLDYNVVTADYGTGRVTATLTIADEGRLTPLTGVYLVIPNEEGSGYVDLSLALATEEVDGKQVVRIHLKKELAQRAEFQLRTSTLDGASSPRTWYYHVIPIADSIEKR